MTRQRQIRRLAAHITALDPGGVRLSRGVQLITTLFLAGSIGAYLPLLLPFGGVPDLHVYCGMAGVLIQLLTPPLPKRAGQTQLWLNALTFTAVLSLAIPLNLVFHDPHPLLIQALWVPVIGAGFFVRRYGPLYEPRGILIALGWLVIVATHPPLETALWLPLAGAIAAISGSLVRLVIWSPSPAKVLKSVERTYGRRLAEVLASIARGRTLSEPEQAHLLHELRQQRGALALAVEAAARAGEITAPEPSLILARSSRQLLSINVVLDAFSKLSEEARAQLTASPVFRKVLRDVVNVTRGGEASGTLPEPAPEAWGMVQDTRAPNDIFRFLRLYQAFDRLLRMREDVQKAVPVSVPDLIKPQPVVPALRLAGQAMLAAGATVAVGHWLQLSHGYWATMALILVLSNSLGQTLRKAVERVLGTAAGVVVALLVFGIFRDHPLVMVALTLITFLFVFVAMERSYVAGAAVAGFAAALGLHAITGIGADGMLERIYDTAIGAGFGFVVALVFFPIRTDKTIRADLDAVLSEAAGLMRHQDTADPETVRAARRLMRTVTRFAKSLAIYRDEQIVLSATTLKSRDFMASVEVLADYVALFCQSRYFAMLKPDYADHQDLMRNLDAAMTDLFARLEARQPVLELDQQVIAEWRAELPLTKPEARSFAVEMVNCLYYARKIAMVLHHLSDDEVFRAIRRV